MERVSVGQHLTPPEGCPDIIKCLMLSCWEQFPMDRITFSKIVEQLSDCNLKRSMGHSNPSYGKSASLEATNSLDVDESKENRTKSGNKRKMSHASSIDKHEVTSWPKLSNFSECSTSFEASQHDKESISEELEDKKSIPSTKPDVVYTVILPEK